MLKGELIRCLTVDQQITAFDLSFDRLRLATCSGISAYVWTSQKLQLLCKINRKPTAAHKARLRHVRFTKENDSVITACNDNRMVVWNLSNGNAAHPVHILDGHASTIYDMVFSQNGDLLYTTGADGRVLIWNWAQGERLQSSITESVPIRALALNPAFQRLACATVMGSIAIWDTVEQARVCTIEGDSEWVKNQSGTASRAAWIDSVKSHSGPVLTAAFSLNGALLVTGAGDSTAKLWSALSLRDDSDSASTQRASMKSANPQVRLREAVDNSVQNDDFVNGTESPLTVGFYAAVLYTFLHEAPVEHVLFTHDSEYIITCARDSTIKIWRVSDGMQAFQVNLPSAAADIRVSHEAESSVPYVIFILLNNRVMALEFGEHRTNSKTVDHVHKRIHEKGLGMSKIPTWPGSVYSSNSHHMHVDIDQLALKGLTRHDLNRALAHRSVKPNVLFAALQAEIVNDQNARPAQLKANMIANNLNPVDVLRAISLTTNFRYQDVLTALSLSGEYAVRACQAVKKGLSLDNILLEMGFSMSSDPVFIHLSKSVLQKCFRSDSTREETSLPHEVMAVAFGISKQNNCKNLCQTLQNDDDLGLSLRIGIHHINSPEDLVASEVRCKEKPYLKDLEVRHKDTVNEKEHVKVGGITSGFHTPNGLIRQGTLHFGKLSNEDCAENDFDDQITLPPLAGAIRLADEMSTGTKLFLRSRIKPPRSSTKSTYVTNLPETQPMISKSTHVNLSRHRISAKVKSLLVQHNDDTSRTLEMTGHSPAISKPH